MAIRGDSYSNVTSVLAITRHLIEGQTAFNTTTRPTKTEVEAFIDEASANLNLALANAGFSPSLIQANSTAKKACDNWVRTKAAGFVELTRPFQGLNSNQSRPEMMQNMMAEALDFASTYSLAFKNLGITESYPRSNALIFTGQDAQADRADPDNDDLEQPKFTRGLFDNTYSEDDNE